MKEEPVIVDSVVQCFSSAELQDEVGKELLECDNKTEEE